VNNGLRLEIAGITFHLRAPPGVRLIEPDSCYQPFLVSSAPAEERVDVEVAVEIDSPPEVAALPVVFDTGESWVAYRDGDDLVINLRHGPHPDAFVWRCRLRGGRVEEVTIHCGEMLVLDRDGDEVSLRSPVYYPLDQLLVDFLLSHHEGILLHAGGAGRGSRAVAFAGVSGAGKSTLCRLFGEDGNWRKLSDDRVVARRIGGTFRVYGTPWAGEERVATNGSAELAALVFLRQSSETRLQRLEAREAMHRLLPVASILWFDGEHTVHSLELCRELVEGVPAYELSFRPEVAAVDLLAQVLDEPAADREIALP